MALSRIPPVGTRVTCQPFGAGEVTGAKLIGFRELLVTFDAAKAKPRRMLWVWAEVNMTLEPKP